MRFLASGFLLSAVLLCGQAPRPVVNAVLHGASYSDGPVAPGMIVVLFGNNLGPAQVVTAQLDAQGRVATTLGETRVLLDELPAPLVYAGQTQVSAIVPYAAAARSNLRVTVTVRGVASDPVTVPVGATGPGLFTQDASGTGPSAALNVDGSLNTRLNSAMPGSVVSLFLTGEGAVAPPAPDGTIAPGLTSVPRPVTVLVAGKPASVLYAGASPGSVYGLAQVNAQLPPDLEFGGALPVEVQIGDAVSQTDALLWVTGAGAPAPGAPAMNPATIRAPSEVTLSWSAGANAARYRIERRVGGTRWRFLAVADAATLSYADRTALTGQTLEYRVRAETAYASSAWSTVNAGTIPVVAAPQNLQASLVGAGQVRLTWNAAATNAALFEIQRRAGVGEFAALGTVAATQSTFTDSGLQPNSIYTWRVRSDNQGFFSPWSNEVTLTIPAQVTTIFLIHGLFQGKEDLRPLATSLAGALDGARFRINTEFDYSRCTSPGLFGSCAGCSITQAAQNLANTILDSRAEGDIVLIGYSLGGLIARDLIANNWNNVFGARRRVAALITLAAPNGGYPYASIDDLAGCQNVLRQMDGNWRTPSGYPAFNASDATRFLPGLIGTWPVARFPGANALWLAAGGQHCDNAVRRLTPNSGCPDASPRSDGVVCQVSALNELPGLPRAEKPNRTWNDPDWNYAHTTGFSGDLFSAGILCGNSGARLPMGNPPPTGLLFRAMRDAILQAPPAPATPVRFDVLGASDGEVRRFVTETVEQGFPAERGEALALLAAYRGAATLPLLERTAQGRELIVYAGSELSLRMLAGDDEAAGRALDNAWQWGNALEVAAAVAHDERLRGPVRAWLERERGTARFQRARERLALPAGHPLRSWIE